VGKVTEAQAPVEPDPPRVAALQYDSGGGERPSRAAAFTAGAAVLFSSMGLVQAVTLGLLLRRAIPPQAVYRMWAPALIVAFVIEAALNLVLLISAIGWFNRARFGRAGMLVYALASMFLAAAWPIYFLVTYGRWDVVAFHRWQHPAGAVATTGVAVAWLREILNQCVFPAAVLAVFGSRPWRPKPRRG
jgi:hypothetical protein